MSAHLAAVLARRLAVSAVRAWRLNDRLFRANESPENRPDGVSGRFRFPRSGEATMRTLLSLASAACLLFAANGRADEQADLQKIIDKAIKAHGTDKAAKDKKASTFKVKGTVHTMGLDLDFTGDYQTQEPDKVRQAMTVNLNGTDVEVVTVFDGKKAWVRAMGNTMDLGEDAVAAFKEEIYAGKVDDLTGLKEKGYKLGSLAEKKIGERAAVGVSVAREGHKDIFLYFDKESGMLVMSERQAKDLMDGQEHKQETRFSNYKEVDGVKRPHKLTIKRDGEKFLEAEVSDVKILDKLDDSTFAKP
jgi:hypothetical protein